MPSFFLSVKIRGFRGYKMTRGLIVCGVTNHNLKTTEHKYVGKSTGFFDDSSN